LVPLPIRDSSAAAISPPLDRRQTKNQTQKTMPTKSSLCKLLEKNRGSSPDLGFW
jgi:hypothetical protein